MCYCLDKESLDTVHDIIASEEVFYDVGFHAYLKGTFCSAARILTYEFPENDEWLAHSSLPFLAEDLADAADSGPEVVQRRSETIGRNEPCPCGSGKKYKKCCLK